MPERAQSLDVSLLPFDEQSFLFSSVQALFHATWPERMSPSAADRQFRRHARKPGFRGIAALADHEQVIGIAYGFTAAPQQAWYEQVIQVVGTPDAAERLQGSFVLAELVVARQQRNQGIGHLLHDAVLIGLPHERAVLSVRWDNTTAISFYTWLGWRTIFDHVRLDADGPAYLIMGRALL
jgi:ribosomal protein S18 acetylase RimI-like enzyme